MAAGLLRRPCAFRLATALALPALSLSRTSRSASQVSSVYSGCASSCSWGVNGGEDGDVVVSIGADIKGFPAKPPLPFSPKPRKPPTLMTKPSIWLSALISTSPTSPMFSSLAPLDSAAGQVVGSHLGGNRPLSSTCDQSPESALRPAQRRCRRSRPVRSSTASAVSSVPVATFGAGFRSDGRVGLPVVAWLFLCRSMTAWVLSMPSGCDSRFGIDIGADRKAGGGFKLFARSMFATIQRWTIMRSAHSIAPYSTSTSFWPMPRRAADARFTTEDYFALGG